MLLLSHARPAEGVGGFLLEKISSLALFDKNPKSLSDVKKMKLPFYQSWNDYKNKNEQDLFNGKADYFYKLARKAFLNYQFYFLTNLIG